MLKHQLTSTSSHYSAIEEDFMLLVERMSNKSLYGESNYHGKIDRFLLREFKENGEVTRAQLVIRSAELCTKKSLSNGLNKMIERGVIVRVRQGVYQLKKGHHNGGDESELGRSAAAASSGQARAACELDSGRLSGPEGGKISLVHGGAEEGDSHGHERLDRESGRSGGDGLGDLQAAVLLGR